MVLANWGTPAPKLNTKELRFYRIDGGTAGTVYRAVPEDDSKETFARKIYEEEETKESERASLELLHEIFKGKKGLRIVRVLGNPDPRIQDFEFIPGISVVSLAYMERFGDPPQSRISQWNRIIERELETRFPGRVSNFHGLFEVEGTRIAINLKLDAFVRDSRTGELVLVDPW